MIIKLLNHACIILHYKKVKLLIDPWLDGSCFEGGWGLRYFNTQSYEDVKDCTHLWISHFHSDHFHIETLKEVLKINPGIQVLGNHSFNFQLDNALKKIGFKNVISFFERKGIALAEDFTVTRYPTTGIDNMLLIKTDSGTVLNYNDCNLAERARKMLAKKIGAVDLFLSNYNHAGKLIEYPLRSNEEIKQELKAGYLKNAAAFAPKYLFPFASHHYYRAPESLKQNNSMLSESDVNYLDKRVVSVSVGDEVRFSTGFENYEIIKAQDNVGLNQFTVEKRERSYSFEELDKACSSYREKIRKGFPIISRWLPDLNINVIDLQKKVRLNIHTALTELNEDAEVHIIASSESLYKWWGKMYGTDSFVVGAHFKITDQPIPVKWQTLTGLMVENRLDIRSLIKMLFSVRGIQFLINRREEIFSILMKGKLQASEPR